MNYDDPAVMQKMAEMMAKAQNEQNQPNFNDPEMMRNMADMMSNVGASQGKPDPEMIRKMAAAMAKEQVDGLFPGGEGYPPGKEGMQNPQAEFERQERMRSAEQNRPGPQFRQGSRQVDYDENYETSRNTISLNTENMQEILSKSQTIVCEECNGYKFTYGTLLKKVSAFISPTDKEAVIPVRVLLCVKCDHIVDQFLPENVLADVLEKEEVSQVEKSKPKRKKKAASKSS